MARIVLNTFGSFGDLHPFLAISLELLARGHDPVIATSEIYREKVTAEGIGFAPLRPDVGELLRDPHLIERVWDPKRGTEYLLREVILPPIEQTFEDLERAVDGADLLVTHTAGLAGPIVAEYCRIPWLSVVLQPMAFFSRCDPPVIGMATWLKHLYPLAQWPFSLTHWAARKITRRWIEPVIQLRRKLGLPQKSNPLFEGQFSPRGTLALFSSRFARSQPDWPPHTEVTGFVFYDHLGSGFEHLTSESQALDQFLRSGSPPLLFTLGSSAVMYPGEFFETSISASQKLGMRAVLLVGERKFQALPETVFTAAYAPYSKIMPQAAAIIHQGGIGTTAQSLWAGRPTLIVPWSHDQPDNAERVRKLGAGRTLARKHYSSKTATSALRELLENPSYAKRAGELRAKLAQEHGVKTACDRIERELQT